MPNYAGVISRLKEPKSIADLAKEGVEQVIVIGHLGRDPESRFAPNGKAITKGAVAVSWGKRDDPQRETR